MLIEIRNRESHLQLHPNEGTCQVRIMTLNESKPFFSTQELKNFFISMASQEKYNKEKKSLNIPKNVSDFEECLPVSVEIRTSLGTKYQVTKSV